MPTASIVTTRIGTTNATDDALPILGIVGGLRVAQSHKNLIAFQPYWMAWRVFGRGHAHSFPVFNVELRAMSWANQTLSIEFPVCERSTVVRAHIFDAVHLGP